MPLLRACHSECSCFDLLFRNQRQLPVPSLDTVVAGDARVVRFDDLVLRSAASGEGDTGDNQGGCERASGERLSNERRAIARL